MKVFGNGTGSINTGGAIIQAAGERRDEASFTDLVHRMTGVASSQVVNGARIHGDYTTGFAGTFTGEAATTARVQGAAANQSGAGQGKRTIDKTSVLYEQALALESYFVKIMLSSMRNTIQKSGLTDGGFATRMYEDMLYDEYTVALTKQAGFGLADQIYLELDRTA
ncbi:MAG: rod-binding protein [Treponema sp.]|nr:rod-binding protein [Treponema sp.]